MNLIASRLLLLEVVTVVVLQQLSYPRRYIIRNVVCCMTADDPQTEEEALPIAKQLQFNACHGLELFSDVR